MLGLAAWPLRAAVIAGPGAKAATGGRGPASNCQGQGAGGFQIKHATERRSQHAGEPVGIQYS
jgi:hypothetical protein